MTGAGRTRRVLGISSWVGVGHVGLCAGAPALARLGVDLLQIPSVVLSNHKAWPAVAGGPTPPETMAAMLAAIDANGWLAGVDAVLVGYLPSAAHVAVAADAVERVRAARPDARIVVDPVMGDWPKGLYIDPAAADAIGDRLHPLADVATPNLFELGRLSGAPVETLDQAVAAAKALRAGAASRRILATSAPLEGEWTGVVEVDADGARLYRAARRAAAPHGVGDVFAALVAAGAPTGLALGRLQALIDASLGAPHLALTGSADWVDAAPIAATPL